MLYRDMAQFGSAPALGVLWTPSTTETAEARKALRHGRLRDFADSSNQTGKRL